MPEPDPRARRRRYYRRRVGPRRWLLVVLSLEQQPGRIITTVAARKDPKRWKPQTSRSDGWSSTTPTTTPNATVLYLHVGSAQEAEGEETPEGHVLRFDPGTHRIVGLTVINARWLLDRDGRLVITIPETVEASADELAPALAAA